VEPADVNAPGETVNAAIIPCKDMIDDGLYKSIKRRSELAIDEGAEYLIFEIQTYGGAVQSADDISKYLILDLGKRVKTVAYVTTEAISAGALVSVACQDIIMLENTTIGDCAPIVMGGKLEGVEREKAESFVRAAFGRAAEANGYPRVLLEAMVSMNMEVWRVKNRQTGEYEFFEAGNLPGDPNVYDLADKEEVVGDDEILTLTASQAKEYGIARDVVSGLEGALNFLEQRDGVKFADSPEIHQTLWSEELVRWINSPAIMSVLVLLALLGAYIELSTPGLGLPGLVAVICVVIIVGSKYLIGLANWLEVAVLVVGLLFLMVEIFVLPGFGIAGVLGITFIMAGLFGMLVKNPPGEVPWPQTEFQWNLFVEGLVGLSIGFFGFLAMAWAVTRFVPRVEFLSGLILTPAEAKTGKEMEANIIAGPSVREQGVGVGEVGVVTSRLRPSGKAKFGDALVDVVSRGEFIEVGDEVKIEEVRGNRVIVVKVGS